MIYGAYSQTMADKAPIQASQRNIRHARNGRGGRICRLFGLPLISLSFFNGGTTLCARVVYSVSRILL